jgi:hypothetical protein
LIRGRKGMEVGEEGEEGEGGSTQGVREAGATHIDPRQTIHCLQPPNVCVGMRQKIQLKRPIRGGFLGNCLRPCRPHQREADCQSEPGHFRHFRHSTMYHEHVHAAVTAWRGWPQINGAPNTRLYCHEAESNPSCSLDSPQLSRLSQRSDLLSRPLSSAQPGRVLQVSRR